MCVYSWFCSFSEDSSWCPLKKNNMKSREEALITAAQTKKNNFVFCHILHSFAGAVANFFSVAKFSCVAGAFMIS